MFVGDEVQDHKDKINARRIISGKNIIRNKSLLEITLIKIVRV